MNISKILFLTASVFLVTIFLAGWLTKPAFAGCNNCQYGCNSYCDAGFSRCNGDCHCCNRSDYAQQTFGVSCGCYGCGNCSCNPPPPPPPCTHGCSCSPSCPAGSSTSKSSDHNCSAGREVCTCTDDCGDRLTHHGSDCYSSEPNSAPAASRLSLCIDGVCTNLSTNSGSPTRFALPNPTQTVVLSATATVPVGSTGLSYAYRIDNKVDGWSCSNSNDYCEGWTTSSTTVNVRNQIGLGNGSNYGVWVHTRSRDTCDSEQKEGPVAYGYFRIDNPPTIVSITPVDLVCNSRWSGKYGEEGVDNPLNVEVTISDPDIAIFGLPPAEEIERAFLALAPDEADNIGDAGCTAWEDNLKNYLGINVGIKVGGDTLWRGVADPIMPDSGCPWLYGDSGQGPGFLLQSVTHRASGNNLVVTFGIRFEDDFPEGEYKWFAMANDRLRAGSCNGAYCWNEFGDWGIDHTLPTLSRTVESYGSDKIEFFWEAADTYEGVYEITTEIDPPLPSYLTAPAGGWFGGVYSPTVPSITGTDLVTVSLNDVPEEGVDISGITKVVTDRACNSRSLGGSSIGWGGAWLRTNGGDVYSDAGTYNYIPDGTDEFVPYPSSYKVMSRYMYLKGLGAGNTLGSANQSCSYSTLSISWDMTTVIEGPLVTDEVYDLISNVADMGEGTVVIGDRTYYIHNNVSSFSAPTDGIQGLHVYYSSGDLTINPDVINSNSNSGALFIAGGDIIIDGGVDHSESSVGTDILEGLFIAGGSFQTGIDLGTNLNYADGLTVRGAAISLGNMSLDRNVGFTDNVLSSSERFVFDARFIDLFRPLIGGSGFIQFVESGAY